MGSRARSGWRICWELTGVGGGAARPHFWQRGSASWVTSPVNHARELFDSRDSCGISLIRVCRVSMCHSGFDLFSNSNFASIRCSSKRRITDQQIVFCEMASFTCNPGNQHSRQQKETERKALDVTLLYSLEVSIDDVRVHLFRICS
jgi:hypothetical protein